MGNCACIEDERNGNHNGELYVQAKAKNGNKYNSPAVAMEVYEQTNFRQANQDLEEFNDEFTLVKGGVKKETPYQPEAEVTVAEPVVVAEPSQWQEPAQQEEEEETFDYNAFSKEIFTVFNRVRLCPENYRHKISGFKSKINFNNFRLGSCHGPVKKRRLQQRINPLVTKVASPRLQIFEQHENQRRHQRRRLQPAQVCHQEL